MTFWFDFHVHTKYSYDSLMDINRIISRAKVKNLNGIAVTDHEIFSYPNLKNEIKLDYDDFRIIPGMEIKSNLGDVIGLMLEESIDSRDFFDIIDEIHAKGGIAVLPHPYKREDVSKLEEQCSKVDWIELFNSRVPEEQNAKSEQLTKKYKKPVVVGSDAHLYSELGRGRIGIQNADSLDDIITEVSKKRIEVETEHSPRRVHYLTSIIGSVKTRDIKPLGKGTIRELKGGGS